MRTSSLALLLFILLPFLSHSQDSTAVSLTEKITKFPTAFFSRIDAKTASLDKQLTAQTKRYLAKIAKREDRLRKKLYKIDSAAANRLFNQSSPQYAALAQKLSTDTGSRTQNLSGAYQPYTDSLRVTLNFLSQHPQLSGAQASEAQNTVSQLQALEAKMQDADQIRSYIQQRKQAIGDYISQHAGMSDILGKDYQDIKESIYYYSQQVREYKELLNDPDRLEQKALSLLNRLPAFQSFMKSNSQLAGLFSIPGSYGSAQALAGLQTRDQVGSLIQGQVAAGGAGGAAAFQSNLQSAESQLDGYKDKLSKLGGGSGDIDMPDFKPNDQKTRSFWRRLEFGTNIQTTRNGSYFPTVTDFGLSLGYKLTNNSTIGIGASYKLGWGNGLQHISLSSQGAGLRSFLDVKIKGSFSATGGLEYNYTTPFTSYQQIRQLQYWTTSGLVGISKTVSLQSRVLKKTKLQLLWDFLSYQQIPKTQPLLFRVGYNF